MPKILLIDSSRERLDTTRRALQRSEYDVSVATSGSYALTVLESGRPDLIARHADIPDTGVSELCPTIRNDPSPSEIPFLLLASPKGPVVGAAAKAGVDMVDAINPSAIVDTIGSFVQTGPGNSRHSAPPDG